MSYDVHVDGVLRLAPEMIARWRRLRISASSLADWPQGFVTEASCAQDSDERPSIGEWIDDCQRYETTGRRFYLRIAEAGGVLSFRGRLTAADFEQYKLAIAVVFRLGGAVGGIGDLTLVGRSAGEILFAYRIRAGGGSSRMTRVPIQPRSFAGGAHAVHHRQVL